LKDLIPAQPEQIIEDFKQMLTYANVVSVNVAEKGINAVLDLAAASRKMDLMEELAQLSAECFLKNRNERAWFRTNLKVVQMMFEAGNTSLISSKLERLAEWCEIAPGVTNPKKESSLLEVLVLQMQCAVSDQIIGKNGLRRLVSRANTIQSSITHPRTLGSLHECSGKVMLFEHRWSQAKQEFFDAFKNYDESGSPRRLVSLRYIVLAALLENSKINPFESPETKSLATHEDIVPVVLLWNAFENLDVNDFNTYVKNAFEKDDFARTFIPLLIVCFQRLKIAEVVKAYSRVRISYIARKLQITEQECSDIIARMILDGLLVGSLDQAEMVLILGEEGNSEMDVKYVSMAQWSHHVDAISNAICKKVVKTNRMD